MSPNENSSVEPSAPTPGLILFNSEEQADIIFLVSENDSENVWRFPAHSFIVENASAMFKSYVEDARNKEKPFNKRITGCKPEIFHIILRHIYTNEITLTNVTHALVIFTAANQFLLNELSSICLTFLYDNCNDETVLQMITHFSQFAYLRVGYANDDNDSLDGTPNLRPVIRRFSNCDNILNELIMKCYYVIDFDANKILSSESFENLDHDLLVKILSRDTLRIASELDLFDAIMRWANQQCNKQCKVLNAENKRALLGKALYCPRYLVMTADEFMKGPLTSDLLTDEEKRSLLAKLTGDSNASLPIHLTARKLDIARKFVERKSFANVLPSTSSANDCNAGIVMKKKSASKKLLNGLGDLVICVIRILD